MARVSKVMFEHPRAAIFVSFPHIGDRPDEGVISNLILESASCRGK